MEKVFNTIMAKNGRKGGIAKGESYKKKINQIILLYINQNFTQKEIAEKIGVSQAMVSKYTNNEMLKIERLKKSFESDKNKEIKLEKMLLEIDLDKNNENLTLAQRIKKYKI